MSTVSKITRFSWIVLMTSLLGLSSQALGAEGATKKARVTHARELLGGSYKKSVVKDSERLADVSEFVKESTRRFLPKAQRHLASDLSKAILSESEHYKMDPIFLMAVIQNESSFNISRVGSLGEIGLMQVRPETAEWIADRYDIDYDDAKSLYDPKTNIKIGAALLDKLRRQFDAESRLYLSAYNIGAKKVRTLVSDNKIPKDYVVAVMKRYVAFYKAVKVKGTSREQSEMAWTNTIELTKKLKKAKKIAER